MKNILLLSLLCLTACSDKSDTSSIATETLEVKPWREILKSDGEIIAASKTPLTTPGEGWDVRTLVDMLPEGSLVKKGQVIARFDAPRSRMELSQAELELLRKDLAEDELKAQSGKNVADLSADQAKVNADLLLSQRYADAAQGIFSRNQVLDAIQDQGFLKDKRVYLNWKSNQIHASKNANEAVLLSQKQSVELNAGRHKKSLASLELIAPHDGILLLSESWSGSKPQVGTNSRPGQEFGSLPDMDKLVASFHIPESRTYGLKTGLPVLIRLAGNGKQLTLKITKVGSSASTLSQESPVKYIDVEAAFETSQVTGFALKPGQAIKGEIVLIDQKQAKTVPNIALKEEAGKQFINIIVDGKPQRVAVELGLRGPVRSEIKQGLKQGEQFALLPEDKSKNKKEDKAI